jgi:hypothetical protein
VLTLDCAHVELLPAAGGLVRDPYVIDKEGEGQDDAEPLRPARDFLFPEWANVEVDGGTVVQKDRLVQVLRVQLEAHCGDWRSG